MWTALQDMTKQDWTAVILTGIAGYLIWTYPWEDDEDDDDTPDQPLGA